MRKTPQEFKRLEVKKVINRTLGESKTVLGPIFIKAEEEFSSGATLTSFSFRISGPRIEDVTLSNIPGKVFVDGIFRGLDKYFTPDFPSLKKIRLSDFKVNPSFSNSRKSMGTDAQATVVLSVHVSDHGIAEFCHKSRSMMYSSFVSALNAYQFYVNCERSFDKIQFFLKDARERNRGDIVSQCTYNLSRLTEVNTYERKV